jgi:signal transduction histidine kinase
VTNALKHGNAQNVIVKVMERGNNIVVEVSDDGSGISPEVTRVNGIANLKMRAEELDGQMTVHSEVGKGTTITWSAPYRKEAS